MLWVTGKRLEAVAGGVVDGVEQRRDDRDHHHLGHALRRLVRRERRQHLDLEIVQRQVGAARDEIVAEIPLPVAGPVLVGRQRFEQRVADAHGEAALRLATHHLRHQRLAAFEDAVGLGDAQRAGRALDLDPDQRAAERREGGADPVVVGRRERRRGAVEPSKLPPPRRTRQRIDVGGPVLARRRGKVACDQAQREKACAIAPVTPLRACAFAAIAGSDSGGRPGQDQLAVLPERLLPIAWRADRFGAMPQSSSAAGHRPKRKMTRGRLGRGLRADMRADRGGGRRADRRHPARVLRGRVLRRLGHLNGIARGDKLERVEGVDLRDRHLVGHAAEMRCHAVGERGADAVAHLDGIGMDRDPAVRVDLHRAQRAVGAGAVVLGRAGHAGPDQRSRLARARLLRGAVAPDRVRLELVENLRRAHRNRLADCPSWCGRRS